jgi:hypothetical protein
VIASARTLRLAGLLAGTLLLALTSAPTVAAHGGIAVGEFHLTIGWIDEPAFVGQPNGVEVFIDDQDEKPVTDLEADVLSVVVSTAGQDSASLPLGPAFSVEDGWGTPGQYSANLIPTSPGEYTFHITGSIHDQAVDVSLTSGEESFSGIESGTELEFPVKQPTLAEVGTRLDRIDGRLEALQSAVPAAGALVDAQSAAAAASAAADRALIIGAILGSAGLVLAVVALAMVMRARKPGAGSA